MFEVIARPGAAFGPCVGDCAHAECAEWRATVALVCVVCGEPIGYEHPFMIESLDWSRVLHRDCALVQFEHARPNG